MSNTHALQTLCALQTSSAVPNAALFCEQVARMQSFAAPPAPRVPCNLPVPCYNTLRLPQLLYYFSWRTALQQGEMPKTDKSYGLLYAFELLNTHQNPSQVLEQFARFWLRFRRFYLSIDSSFGAWFAEYYLCHEVAVPFAALVQQLGLQALLPPAPPPALATLCSYPFATSRFFAGQPERVALLERALALAAQNLQPLLRLYSLAFAPLFWHPPAKYQPYQPFRNALVALPCVPKKEVMLGEQLFRLQGHSWSCAAASDWRLPNHALGWLCRRLELYLRAAEPPHAPVPRNGDPTSATLLEHWHSHEPQQNPALAPLLADARLERILKQCAALAAHKPPPAWVALSQQLQQEQTQEPLRSLLQLPPAAQLSPCDRFRRQGEYLQSLTATLATPPPAHAPGLCYATLTPLHLQQYIAFRTCARQALPLWQDPGFAQLYCAELCFGIGTSDPVQDLATFLARYAAADKIFARRIATWLLALCVWLGQDPLQALQRVGVCAFYPAWFLCRSVPQLPLFLRIAQHPLHKSRFFTPALQEPFAQCLEQVLQRIATEFEPLRPHLVQESLTKPTQLLASLAPNPAAHAPPVCLPNPTLRPWTAFFANYVLRRIESRLRLACGYPWPLQCSVARLELLREDLALQRFCTNQLEPLLDAEVEAFVLAHPLPAPTERYARASRTSKPKALPKKVPVAPAKPAPMPTHFDPQVLARIRSEAEHTMRQLLVEPPEDAPPPAPPPPPPRTEPGGWHTFWQALAPAQQSYLQARAAHQNHPLPVLQIDAINELALAHLGDVVLDTAQEAPVLFAEYAGYF